MSAPLRLERDRLTRPATGWMRTLLGTAILLLSACSASTPSTRSVTCERTSAFYLQATPPVAADGVVVIATTASLDDYGEPTNSVAVGQSYDVITALRASDGSVLWQRPDPLTLYGGDLRGVDTLGDDHGTLIVSNMRGHSAVRLSDGTVLWQTRLGSLRPPVFEGDVIYANDGQSLSAIRLSDGQLLWQFSALAPLPPVASGDVVYAASFGSVLALRASDGAILWQTIVPSASPTPTPIPNPTGRNHLYVPGPSSAWVQPLAVVGDHLYVSADQGRLLLVRTRDGRVAGQIPSNLQSHTVVPILIDSTLYLAVTDVSPTHQKTLSLQTSEQKLLWRLPLGAQGGAIIAANDGAIYVNSGSLLAIRLADGTVLWHAPLSDGHFGSGGGQVFFSQFNSFVWHFDTCAASNAPLATVTALSTKDGSISWVTHIPVARS